jgi:hypothetical protein
MSVSTASNLTESVRHEAINLTSCLWIGEGREEAARAWWLAYSAVSLPPHFRLSNYEAILRIINGAETNNGLRRFVLFLVEFFCLLLNCGLIS